MLQINEKYVVGSDSMNIILYQREVAKSGKTLGKERWRATNYYSNFGNALKALVDMEIRGTGLQSFESVVAKIEELKLLIDSLRGKELPRLS